MICPLHSERKENRTQITIMYISHLTIINNHSESFTTNLEQTATLAPLCETDRDAVVIRDSIVRHVRATLAEGKVHTHCVPGARVLDVFVQIPAILKDDESVAAVVIHAGANDTKLRQTETLKRDFRSLIETVRNTSPAATIIVSGPLPTY